MRKGWTGFERGFGRGFGRGFEHGFEHGFGRGFECGCYLAMDYYNSNYALECSEPYKAASSNTELSEYYASTENSASSYCCLRSSAKYNRYKLANFLVDSSICLKEFGIPTCWAYLVGNSEFGSQYFVETCYFCYEIADFHCNFVR